MKELVKTNDIVIISLIEVLLREQSINYIILDQNMSILEGSLGVIPQRIMTINEDHLRARQILIDAQVGVELEALKD